jgi:hypothetical protein
MRVPLSTLPVKIDLHTHSEASPDGALTEADYRRMLDSGKLDFIAVTDHNTADFAIGLRKRLGDRIIVGEEIRTTQGEIIGLYLRETVPKLMSPADTVAAIREQGGLVCVPHPFEDVRRGLHRAALDAIADDIDMIEVHNGRAVFQNKSKQAYAWAALHDCRGVANSDSHASSGWGRTYTCIAKPPTRDTFVDLLQEAEYIVGFPGLRAVLYPKFNRLRKRRV